MTRYFVGLRCSSAGVPNCCSATVIHSIQTNRRATRPPKTKPTRTDTLISTPSPRASLKLLIQTLAAKGNKGAVTELTVHAAMLQECNTMCTGTYSKAFLMFADRVKRGENRPYRTHTFCKWLMKNKKYGSIVQTVGNNGSHRVPVCGWMFVPNRVEINKLVARTTKRLRKQIAEYNKAITTESGKTYKPKTKLTKNSGWSGYS